MYRADSVSDLNSCVEYTGEKNPCIIKINAFLVSFAAFMKCIGFKFVPITLMGI